MKILTGQKRRQVRIRAKMKAFTHMPRISVFRSNKYFYAQVLDGEKGKVLASSSSFDVRKGKEKVNKSQEAKLVGTTLAAKMIKKGIKAGVLDRKSYAYKGRVQAFTDGLREGGVKI